MPGNGCLEVLLEVELLYIRIMHNESKGMAAFSVNLSDNTQWLYDIVLSKDTLPLLAATIVGGCFPSGILRWGSFRKKDWYSGKNSSYRLLIIIVGPRSVGLRPWASYSGEIDAYKVQTGNGGSILNSLVTDSEHRVTIHHLSHFILSIHNTVDDEAGFMIVLLAEPYIPKCWRHELRHWLDKYRLEVK